MTSNKLFEIGLENLTKSDEWNRVSNIIWMLHTNVRPVDVTVLDRFGQQLENVVIKEKQEYHKTISGLKAEIESLRQQLMQVLATVTVKRPTYIEIALLQDRLNELYYER